VIVVSDTNVLSSLAAGDSLPALLRLFARSTLCIPPSVRDELQVGLDKGKTYLEPIFRAAITQQIDVVPLSPDTAQRLASSWSQAGYLKGRARKIRTRPYVTPVVAAFAVLLGYLCGVRGSLLLDCTWTRLLDCSLSELTDLVTETSKQGW
jgi:predicted nucleic acid-binding protein